jgi:hypothetical protein
MFPQMGRMFPQLGSRERIDSLVGQEITRPIHKGRIIEARVSFWLAVALVIVGVGIVIWAVIGGSDLKSTKFIGGILVNVFGGFVLKLHRNADAELSTAVRDNERREMINSIQDPVNRDQAILDYLQSLEKKSWLKRLFGQ